MKKCKNFLEKYKHGIPLLIYLVIYLVWFAWLEKTNVKDYQLIHVSLDDHIPFLEVFIIPYLLWFGYVAVVVVYLFFKNKQDYYKACAFLFTGMTIFLIISTLWPNGHDLRPVSMPRDNCFTWLVSMLWKTDTPTNLWPSIHVFNSMGAHFAVMHSWDLAQTKFGRPIKVASGVLSVSIIFSTMFIKQHSVFDVVTGILMGAVMYAFVYRKEWLLVFRPAGKDREKAAGGGISNEKSNPDYYFSAYCSDRRRMRKKRKYAFRAHTGRCRGKSSVRCRTVFFRGKFSEGKFGTDGRHFRIQHRIQHGKYEIQI